MDGWMENEAQYFNYMFKSKKCVILKILLVLLVFNVLYIFYSFNVIFMPL